MQIRYTIGTGARVRGVEPRRAVLEAAGSPRSTLVSIKKWGILRESNPYLLVHSQACSDRYTTDTINWAAGTEVGRPMNQSRYAIRVTGRAMGVGSASAFCTTRCHTWR